MSEPKTSGLRVTSPEMDPKGGQVDAPQVLIVLSWWISIKESTCNAGDASLIPGSGRFPGEGNGNPLQYSYLGYSMGCTEEAGGLQSLGYQKSWT